ncbi:hypothetical protein MERGE_003015 [Pneumocystis wakefieldiae]|uniref:Trafficking protein particle complex subunit n=1 Tax=Pneumocystis wakefieldiae TaxID=38082 RepID=A0A899G0H4_9ASCO|nr:hypothetical protein MERGE_003015 [Pneumocystis wakefieldiae]
MIFSVYIINKAGGLIYQKDFNEGLLRLGSNDYLVLAGIFHGIHAITAKISPLAGLGGLEVLEAQTFHLQCFQTLTGIKFLLITEPQQPNVDALMRRIYELYADYVMKNPFYKMEMPIRCELFDINVTALLESIL